VLVNGVKMLSIKNLYAGIPEKEILKGLNLEIGSGEVHAIMGPNGSGKSSLANVLVGREGYEVTKGSVMYQGENLLDLDPDVRATKGFFLAFQYPIEIPGVNNAYFLRTALNAQRRSRGESEVDAYDFMALMTEKLKLLEMDKSFLTRGLNEGFSGGEKKRNEILQMLVLEPKLAMLDETDSGLDIDALRIIANGVNALRDKNRSFLMITHYQRLLDFIKPDYVHVLANGKIIKSGDHHLPLELEEKGYGWLGIQDGV
jgi:Fe-S cluster assembly ATP-binding protein